MDHVIEQIRAAIVRDASPDTRSAGIAACRAVLAAPEATPGEPLMSTVAEPAPNPLGQILGALRGAPPEQLLELAIAKLRAALPAGTEAPPLPPLKFHLIPIPTTQRGSR